MSHLLAICASDWADLVDADLLRLLSCFSGNIGVFFSIKTVILAIQPVCYYYSSDFVVFFMEIDFVELGVQRKYCLVFLGFS